MKRIELIVKKIRRMAQILEEKIKGIYMPTGTHCDNVIHNDYPICLRYFILVNRLPAIDACVITESQGQPKCFANYEDKRVRLVMASRFGDIGVTYNLQSERGYDIRIFVDDLSNFSGGP